MKGSYEKCPFIRLYANTYVDIDSNLYTCHLLAHLYLD